MQHIEVATSLESEVSCAVKQWYLLFLGNCDYLLRVTCFAGVVVCRLGVTYRRPLKATLASAILALGFGAIDRLHNPILAHWHEYDIQH